VSSAPSVLLLDDGELDRVSNLLAEIGAEFVHLRGNEVHDRFQLPRDLLVTTATRAVWISELDNAPSWSGSPLWITIHNQDYLPFRERLREIGVHFLVHSAADLEALRLLILYALYGGAEKRDQLRIPVGHDVSFRMGTRTRNATLVELSIHGCRIVAAEEAPSGTRIVITVPEELARGHLFKLPGRVVRAVPEEGEQAGKFSIAIAFEEMTRGAEAELDSILEGRSIGTLVTPLGEEAPERHAEDDLEGERRRENRSSYGRKVTALIGEATRILLGRDLSTGGMRIEPRPDLRVGSHIRLAIHGSSREEPIIVPATIIRDDGDQGLALRFLGSEEVIAQYLERLVADEAPVESLSGDDSGRVVVTSLLPDDEDDPPTPAE
jgi:hypothetical protein